MTPLQIEILMRVRGYRPSTDDGKKLDPFETSAVDWLCTNDLLMMNTRRERSPYGIEDIALTDRGKCFVEAVLKLPLPGRRSEWTMPA